MTTTAHTTAPPTPTDAELQAAVVSELIWVKDVDTTHVGVAASDGAITLSGEVGSFPEKRLAVKAAQCVCDANGVADEMTVRTTFGAANDTDVARERARRSSAPSTSRPRCGWPCTTTSSP